MKYVISFVLFLLAGLLRGELIPAARLADWSIGTRTGVVGGIPTRTVIADDGNANGITDSLESIDATGATDVAAAIQAAVNEASANEIVRLPAGTFRIDSTITLGTAFSNKTLRGAGAATIIDVHCAVGIQAGPPTDYFRPATPGLLVTSGMSRGSTALTLDGDHSYLTPGYLITVQIKADQTIPVMSVSGYDVETTEAQQKQLVRVVSKAGDVITISPPLLDAYGAGSLEVRIATMSFNATGIGLEDLTVDCTSYTGGPGGSYAGVSMTSCYNSWMTGVKSIEFWNYGIVSADCLHTEIRTCYAGHRKGASTSGGCILFASWSSIVEDCIFVDSFPNVQINAGCAGNVWLYNYGDEMCNTNHGPHNQFNLHEGNAWNYMISDGYFGSESDLTVHRNFIWSTEYGNVIMRRFSRRFSVTGNFLGAYSALASQGYPNIGNTDYTGEAQLSMGDPWRDYQMTGTLTTRTSDSAGVVTLASGLLHDGTDPNTQIARFVWGAASDQQRSVAISTVAGSAASFVDYVGGTALPDVGTVMKVGPGAFFDGTGIGSFQERDLDVAATAIDKGNYFLATSSLSSLGGDTLPDSLCGDSKAASEARGVVWGSLAWPPFDTANLSTADVERIPAAYRYLNGTDPGGGGGGTITTGTLSAGTLNVGG